MQVAGMEAQADERRRCAAQMHTQLQLRAETMAVLALRHAPNAVTQRQSTWICRPLLGIVSECSATCRARGRRKAPLCFCIAYLPVQSCQGCLGCQRLSCVF